MNKSLLLSLSLLLTLTACRSEDKPQEEVRPVRYVVAGAASQTAGEQYSGEIRARHETQLSFQVGGKVIAKLVNSGEHVRKGQKLARLDPSDYALDQAAKEAQLAAAQSDLDKQQLNLKRYRELLSKQFVSQAQVDDQQNGVNAARAKVDQARAALSASRNQHGYTQLAADADGVISQMQAEPGLVVAAGTPVARLSQDGAREVAIQVPENALARVKAAAHFTVTLWSGGQPLAGTLRELAADADPATRTYAARIALQGDSHALPLGQTATVSLPTHANSLLQLPLTALLDEAGKHYVWRINGQRVEKREVQVAAINRDSVTLQNGVTAGEKIVTAGVHLLRPGQPVRLLEQ